MLTAAEFTQRMERIDQAVSRLSQSPHEPAARDAAELLQTFSDLHAEGLRRILSLIQAAGVQSGSVLEKFAQDDLIRTLLLHHSLHPVPLRTRLEEAVDNMRPLVESYGGSVSISEVTPTCVTLRLQLHDASERSPAKMLRELLEHAVLVAAPDAGEIAFDDRPPRLEWLLPIVTVR